MKEKKMPWLAGILSIVPGAGQLYNGQYSKGIAIFALLIISAILFVVSLIGPELLGISFYQRGFFWFTDEPKLQKLITILLFVFVAVPLIIIYSIFDAVSSARRINEQQMQSTRVVNQGVNQMNDMNQSNVNQPEMNEPNMHSNPEMNTENANTGNQSWSSPQGEKQFDQQTPPRQPANPPSKRGYLFWAIVFLGIGFMGMLQFLDLDLSHAWNRLWPLIPLALGLKLLADYHHQGEVGQMILGAFFTAVGVLFFLNNWGINWPWEFFEEMWEGVWWLVERFWWLVMMIIGSFLLISYYHSKRSTR